MALTAEQSNAVVTYTDTNGEEIKLSPNIIKQFLVNGSGNVTDQEVVMFLNLCRYQKLNPFLKEAYLIKYSSKSPATIVTGKDAFTKRAQRNERFEGLEAGVIVHKGENLEYRTGTLVLPSEKLVGGWAKVHVKGYVVPIESTASFEEYAGYKEVWVNGEKTGRRELNSQWSSKPATMIRKVALVQALREAFPEDLQGLYGEEEMGVEVPTQEPAEIRGEATDMTEEILEIEYESKVEQTSLADELGSLFD